MNSCRKLRRRFSIGTGTPLPETALSIVHTKWDATANEALLQFEIPWLRATLDGVRRD